MSTPEGKTQNAICEYLAKKGHFFMRLNNQPVYDKSLRGGYGGYRTQGKWAQPGMADILLIDRNDYGKAVFLEVKTARGRQSADQLFFEKQCHLHNAEYQVVRSVEDVKSLGL